MHLQEFRTFLVHDCMLYIYVMQLIVANTFYSLCSFKYTSCYTSENLGRSINNKPQHKFMKRTNPVHSRQNVIHFLRMVREESNKTKGIGKRFVTSAIEQEILYSLQYTNVLHSAVLCRHKVATSFSLNTPSYSVYPS